MPYDLNYPDTYRATIKGVEVSYTHAGNYKYCELYKSNADQSEEIDIRIRDKNALKLALNFIKSHQTNN